MNTFSQFVKIVRDLITVAVLTGCLWQVLVYIPGLESRLVARADADGKKTGQLIDKVRTEIPEIRKDLMKRSDDIEMLTDRRTADLLKLTDRHLLNIENIADARSSDALGELHGARVDANAQLSLAVRTLAMLPPVVDSNLAKFNDSVAKVAVATEKAEGPATELFKVLADAAPDFFECDHNPSCLFNEYVGVRHDLNAITLDIHREADKLVAPPCKPSPKRKGIKRVGYAIRRGGCEVYARTIGPLMVVARVYGATQ